MRKIYSFYLPILALFSSLVVNAADKVESENFRSALEIGDFEFLNENSKRTISQLIEIVETNKNDERTCILSLYSICERGLDGNRDFVENMANFFYQLVQTDNDWSILSYMTRIYDKLQNQELRTTCFQKWYNAWSRFAQDAEFVAKLQARGLPINTLQDLLQLDPITVLNITDHEFI